MASKLETILSAIAGLLSANLTATVLRNEPPLGVTVPKTGLIILRDGDPGEPDQTMSPLTYHYEHEAELEIIVQRAVGRDAAFDALRVQVDGLISANRTLGGADWIEISQARSMDLQVDGSAPIKGMSLPLTLHFATSTPLS